MSESTNWNDFQRLKFLFCYLNEIDFYINKMSIPHRNVLVIIFGYSWSARYANDLQKFYWFRQTTIFFFHNSSFKMIFIDFHLKMIIAIRFVPIFGSFDLNQFDFCVLFVILCRKQLWFGWRSNQSWNHWKLLIHSQDISLFWLKLKISRELFSLYDRFDWEITLFFIVFQ